MSDLWSEASRSYDAENNERKLTAARVAATPIWPFLAAATTRNDYENRKAIVADRFEAAVVEAAGDVDVDVLTKLEASFDEDFRILHAANLREARLKISTATTASKCDEGGCKTPIYRDSFDGSWKHDGADPGHAPMVSDRTRARGDNAAERRRSQDAAGDKKSNPYMSGKTAGRLSKADIPADFEVQPIDPNDPNAKDPATDGECGLTWDDGISTGITPAPGGRCPFEYFHKYEASKTAGGLDNIPEEKKAEPFTSGDGNGESKGESNDSGNGGLGNIPEGEKAKPFTSDDGHKSPEEVAEKKDENKDKEASKIHFASKTAVHLNNVSLDGDNGVGTDPSGNRVKFKLSPEDRKQLSDVLFGDLAQNFSGVDVEQDEIISEGSRRPFDASTSAGGGDKTATTVPAGQANSIKVHGPQSEETCHCGGPMRGSDHCSYCGCEAYETYCDEVYDSAKDDFHEGSKKVAFDTEVGSVHITVSRTDQDGLVNGGTDVPPWHWVVKDLSNGADSDVVAEGHKNTEEEAHTAAKAAADAYARSSRGSAFGSLVGAAMKHVLAESNPYLPGGNDYVPEAQPQAAPAPQAAPMESVSPTAPQPTAEPETTKPAQMPNDPAAGGASPPAPETGQTQPASSAAPPAATSPKPETSPVPAGQSAPQGVEEVRQ